MTIIIKMTDETRDMFWQWQMEIQFSEISWMIRIGARLSKCVWVKAMYFGRWFFHRPSHRPWQELIKMISCPLKNNRHVINHIPDAHYDFKMCPLNKVMYENSNSNSYCLWITHCLIPCCPANSNPFVPPEEENLAGSVRVYPSREKE